MALLQAIMNAAGASKTEGGWQKNEQTGQLEFTPYTAVHPGMSRFTGQSAGIRKANQEGAEQVYQGGQRLKEIEKGTEGNMKLQQQHADLEKELAHQKQIFDILSRNGIADSPDAVAAMTSSRILSGQIADLDRKLDVSIAKSGTELEQQVPLRVKADADTRNAQNEIRNAELTKQVLTKPENTDVLEEALLSSAKKNIGDARKANMVNVGAGDTLLNMPLKAGSPITKFSGMTPLTAPQQVTMPDGTSISMGGGKAYAPATAGQMVDPEIMRQAGQMTATPVTNAPAVGNTNQLFQTPSVFPKPPTANGQLPPEIQELIRRYVMTQGARAF